MKLGLPPCGTRSATSTTIDFGANCPFTFVPAYCLPVYASQSPLPDTTQDSVRGCRLSFTAVAILGDMVSCAFKAQPASILTSRRRRRAKTDRIDGETLVRTLMAFKRGEPRVCSMARAPTPQEEEDRRRVCRERRTLMGERVRHVNRIKGLLFAQWCIR